MAHAKFDVDLLADLIRSRRKGENLSLRDAAGQAGVSAPTLQRIEAGQVPNTASLMRIADWLEIPVDDLRRESGAGKQGFGTLTQIEVHLRADPCLDEKAATAITEAVQKLYAAYSRQHRNK
jgi:transcriptional regulator with XRE-family HTH domain